MPVLLLLQGDCEMGTLFETTRITDLVVVPSCFQKIIPTVWLEGDDSVMLASVLPPPPFAAHVVGFRDK
jgi:hypothetical protein